MQGDRGAEPTVLWVTSIHEEGGIRHHDLCCRNGIVIEHWSDAGLTIHAAPRDAPIQQHGPTVAASSTKCIWGRYSFPGARMSVRYGAEIAQQSDATMPIRRNRTDLRGRATKRAGGDARGSRAVCDRIQSAGAAVGGNELEGRYTAWGDAFTWPVYRSRGLHEMDPLVTMNSLLTTRSLKLRCIGLPTRILVNTMPGISV
ncbi:hypothetical protein BKA93DRAFT_52157 [Sparassis latifolia]